MELTWLAIGASIAMALAAVCVFIFAVKKDYFHNIEDTKFQVFWSDLEDVDAELDTLTEDRSAHGPHTTK